MSHGHVETLHNDGTWHNVIEGTDQVSEPFDTQEAAAAEGREMARDLGVGHVVKNLDGTIAESTDDAPPA
jgi:hypothetical protein